MSALHGAVIKLELIGRWLVHALSIAEPPVHHPAARTHYYESDARTEDKSAGRLTGGPRFGTLAVDEDIAGRFAPKPPRVCPRCRGEGKVGPSSRGWTDPERERDCERCYGDGEIPA